jgi:fumarylacetoacetase
VTACHPLGVFRDVSGSGRARVAARAGDAVLDLAAAARGRSLPWADLADQPSLNPLMAAGSRTWHEVRNALPALVADGPLVDASDVEMVMPFEVADYVDFYASEHHAARLGRILRPGQDPLPPAWRHQPLGYHGRAGTVVVSGTPVRRPVGPVRTDGGDVELAPTRRLDVEAELGFVVGVGSAAGSRVGVDAFADHVFGVVVVNDWSARDIQAFETVPLGPFLGKSFQTSVSAWVVPLADLAAARIAVPSFDGSVPVHLVEPEPWGLDIAFELRVNGQLVSRPSYRTMHWSPAQMLAHLTVNGARLRTGDLYASGTVSGPSEHEAGSLVEIDGHDFLADGDEVVITATAPADEGGVVELGEVRGRVLPADVG